MRCWTRQQRASRAFSLVELLIVIAVTALLTSLMMPAIASLRDQVDRLISSSNMRQVGMGMTMHSGDNNGRLPYSALVRVDNGSQMHEMMATYIGDNPIDFGIDRYALGYVDNRGFDGIGILYDLNYITIPDVMYSPSHTGSHPLERYADQYDEPENVIYGNFHYRGDIDPFAENRPYLTFHRNPERVYLTDGMRTRQDLNHKTGYHLMRGDGAVQWKGDASGKLAALLPDEEDMNMDPGDGDLFQQVWQLLDKPE